MHTQLRPQRLEVPSAAISPGLKVYAKCRNLSAPLQQMRAGESKKGHSFPDSKLPDGLQAWYRVAQLCTELATYPHMLRPAPHWIYKRHRIAGLHGFNPAASSALGELETPAPTLQSSHGGLPNFAQS